MSELSIVVAPPFGDIALELYPNLSLPDTLTVGEHYIYVDRCDVGARLVSLDVQFVAYTACPAIVIVLDGSGQKVRILRDDLYVYPRSSQHGSTHDDPSTE